MNIKKKCWVSSHDINSSQAVVCEKLLFCTGIRNAVLKTNCNNCTLSCVKRYIKQIKEQHKIILLKLPGLQSFKDIEFLISKYLSIDKVHRAKKLLIRVVKTGVYDENCVLDCFNKYKDYFDNIFLKKLTMEIQRNRFQQIKYIFHWATFPNRDIYEYCKYLYQISDKDATKQVLLIAAKSGYYSKEYLESIVKKFKL